MYNPSPIVHNPSPIMHTQSPIVHTPPPTVHNPSPKQPSYDVILQNSNNKNQTQTPSTSNCEFDLTTFSTGLVEWAVNDRVTHSCVNNLLAFLKKYKLFKDLPTDSRTLLNTPRSVIVREINYGYYWHYGLKRGILTFFNNNYQSHNKTKIE